MFKTTNLSVKINNTQILTDISINLNKNQVHLLVGPNGSGKSTFLKAIQGKKGLSESIKSIFLNDQNIGLLSPDQRVLKGLYVSYQEPVSVPGVATVQIIKKTVQKKLEAKGLKYSPKAFLDQIKIYTKKLNLPENFYNLDCNVQMSGGQKKKNELLQMFMIDPEYAFLDEIDSGLDIDAVKEVATAISGWKKDKGLFLVTHNLKLVQFIKPDFVHVLIQGKIVKTGGLEIIQEIEKFGYGQYI
jgi:Fe-S cluster assembly ATP-binding protein